MFFLRVAVVAWLRALPALDDPDLGYPADFVKIAHVGTRIDALNAVNMVFSFVKVFKYAAEWKSCPLVLVLLCTSRG